MRRRDFLKTSAIGALGATPAFADVGRVPRSGPGTPQSGPAFQSAPAVSTRQPIRMFFGGYGPASTGFSLAMKKIGDRLEARFGGDVEVKYVYNILDLGYRGEDILWLVEQGVLTLGYQSSSYLTERAPDLGVADLPFLFSDARTARAAMDGRFGLALTGAIEAAMNYRVLGYFENGFRHISNRVRPVRTPADLKGLKIRVLPSQVQA